MTSPNLISSSEWPPMANANLVNSQEPRVACATDIIWDKDVDIDTDENKDQYPLVNEWPVPVTALSTTILPRSSVLLAAVVIHR